MQSVILKWTRRFPNSTNNFDLILENPLDLDSARMIELLKAIKAETHRSLSLKDKAAREFHRFFEHPHTPLRSEAYVLLSNWFMTRSGDRNSTVATRCENLWDALFPCRPPVRLSSPAAGLNHVILPAAFESFWQILSRGRHTEIARAAAANQGSGHTTVPSIKGTIDVQLTPDNTSPAPDQTGSNRLRAVLQKGDVRCEVEGSAATLAEFVRMLSEL